MSTLAEVMARSYAAAPQERLIDAHELARLLGLRDDPREIHRRAKRQGWPIHNVGERLLRFRYSEVMAAIDAPKPCENQPQREPIRMQRKETR